MIKPELINPDDLLRKSQNIEKSLAEEEAEEERQQQFLAAQEVQQELDDKGFKQDPKGEEVTKLLKEEQADITGIPEVDRALAGAALTTTESLLTFAERVKEMTTGEMSQEIKETGEYKPDWFNSYGGAVDFLQDAQEDVQTKTWWGGLIEVGAHYGLKMLLLVQHLTLCLLIHKIKTQPLQLLKPSFLSVFLGLVRSFKAVSMQV
jgi:hypothetical protein